MIWSNIKLQLKGNIRSLSANTSSCFGVTDAGEIIKSNDGLNWSVTDYNKEYSVIINPASLIKYF